MGNRHIEVATKNSRKPGRQKSYGKPPGNYRRITRKAFISLFRKIISGDRIWLQTENEPKSPAGIAGRSSQSRIPN